MAEPGRTWEEARAELLSESPELAAEVDATRPAFLVARELIRERMAQGLSQVQVAERMGSSQSIVSRLERMETIPNLRTVNDVARALGCELDIRFVKPGEQAAGTTVVSGVRDLDLLASFGAPRVADLGAALGGVNFSTPASEPVIEVGFPIPWIAGLVEHLVDERLAARHIAPLPEWSEEEEQAEQTVGGNGA